MDVLDVHFLGSFYHFLNAYTYLYLFTFTEIVAYYDKALYLIESFSFILYF